MGNALLDFVMALVRDPATAARYATDPAGALAAAGLSGVAPADVAGLIPMVSDSLAMSTPDFGPVDGNDPSVWSSGAAAVAFESFGAADRDFGATEGARMAAPADGPVIRPAEPESSAAVPAPTEGYPDPAGLTWADPAGLNWADPAGSDQQAPPRDHDDDLSAVDHPADPDNPLIP